MTQSQWAANVILVDADYLDRVAFDLIVNFERMIGRRIPQADLCHWLDCIALDGGIKPGDNAVQAVFLHSKKEKTLRNFTPSDYVGELNGKAFKDRLGEFSLLSFPVEDIVSTEDFYVQSLEEALNAEGVKNIMLVADLEAYGNRVKQTAAEAEGKDITLFTMQPTSGRGFSQEILGYSLMSALGIRGDEL